MPRVGANKAEQELAKSVALMEWQEQHWETNDNASYEALQSDLFPFYPKFQEIQYILGPNVILQTC